MNNNLGSIKNIGGAFSLLDTDPFMGATGDFSNYFPEILHQSSKRVFLETGVDAMAYIIRGIIAEKNIKEVFFPIHYCQDSIERLKNKVKNIRINRYENPDELLNRSEPAVIIWNHFNKYVSPPSKILAKTNLIIIEDFVQAPLDMMKSKSAYCFNSLRKFCNLELAVCYTDSSKKIQVSDKPSSYYLEKKNAQIIKHYFQKTGFTELEEKYLDCFKQAEKKTTSSYIVKAFITEIAKLHHIDFGAIHSNRLKNYAYLSKVIQSIKKIKLLKGDYMYLIIDSKYRNELRNHLMKEHIFTAIHWADSFDKEKANSYLSIHIDHRYQINDLKKIAASFLSYAEFGQ